MLKDAQEGVREFFEEFLRTGKDRELYLMAPRKEIPGLRAIKLGGYAIDVTTHGFTTIYQELTRESLTGKEGSEHSSTVPYLKVVEMYPGQISLNVSMFNQPETVGYPPTWLSVDSGKVCVTVESWRESFRTELQELLRDISDTGRVPTIFWIYEYGSPYGVFLGTQRELPKRQVYWNLDSARSKLMKEVLGVGELLQTAHSTGPMVRGYYRKHVWAATNRPDVYWHFVGWEEECVGGDHYFLTVNVPVSEFQPEKPRLW